MHARNMFRLLAAGLLSGSLATGCATVDEDFAEAVGSTRAPLLKAEKPIQGEYIVVFKDQIGVQGLNAAVNRLSLRSAESRIERQWSVIPAVKAKLSKQDLNTVLASSDVAFVEENGTVSINDVQPAQADGIDRIDQRNLPRDGQYNDFGRDGSGVTVYIVDTGINTSHNEFSGRIADTADFVGDGRNGEDCNGHGTHVASSTAGATFGVADGASIVGVRVLNCQGSGSFAGVIDGVEFVAQDCSGDCVANMSLGGGFSAAVNQAVAGAVAAGVPFAVAAGNENTDACTRSPASEPSALTVAAAADNDSRASFSNFGSCVDIFAPGVSILGAWIGGSNATNTISGTSMASPHVAGVAAQCLQENPGSSPAAVEACIEGAATQGIISGVNGSPNLMLYADIGDGGDPPPPPPPGDSCEGRCGNFDSSKSCQCDDACTQFGDCCDDFDELCNSQPDPNSCLDNNACGGQAPGGCFCDNACVQFGDCCSDGPC